MKSFALMILFLILGALFIKHGSSYGLAIGLMCFMFSFWVFTLIRRAWASIPEEEKS